MVRKPNACLLRHLLKAEPVLRLRRFQVYGRDALLISGRGLIGLPAPVENGRRRQQNNQQQKRRHAGRGVGWGRKVYIRSVQSHYDLPNELRGEFTNYFFISANCACICLSVASVRVPETSISDCVQRICSRACSISKRCA